jgi:hypothetical protein
MKKSELRAFIKEQIKSSLVSEATENDVKVQQDLNIELEKTADLMSKMDMNEEDELEPSKSELNKSKGLAKAKEELAQLTKQMKSLARKYKEAEGEEKAKIVADLKEKTKLKKELDAIIDK